ncbi:MAG: hypothetical protein V7L23_17310 [Nostoc sp.]|uniref:hypothetical protein n=1 Tax=Nostoc sp. TaxID=1180 RepID=UPI002FF12AC6
MKADTLVRSRNRPQEAIAPLPRLIFPLLIWWGRWSGAIACICWGAMPFGAGSG